MLMSTVEKFIDWLYTNKCPETPDDWVTGLYQGSFQRGVQLAILRACAFGNRVMARVFQTSAQAALIRSIANGRRLPFFESIIFAFANLPSNNIILTLLVDAHCQDYKAEFDDIWDGELELRSQLPKEFLLRAMLRYSAMREAPVTNSLDPCDYHEHESEKEKEACQKKSIIKDTDQASEADDEENENGEVGAGTFV